jgi:hypothetical protein
VSVILTVILLLAAAWCCAALYIDVPAARLRLPLAALFAIAMVAAIFWKNRWVGRGVCVAGVVAVLIWWFSLAPSNARRWIPDVAQTAWAEIDGDRIVMHNVRYCDYRTETDYTARWERRSYSLAQLRGIDLFITYWGSPYIAHPILSFQFGDDAHLAFSIETRREVGEEYSAVLGFFRQYELTFIAADERDVIRLRTNYRKGEDVYLYRTTVPPEQARAILLNYLSSTNSLHTTPEWYNALTKNCTTDIRMQTKGTVAGGPMPWDYRILVSGLGDEMAYERGILAGALPFDELKRRAHINPVAHEAPEAEFSRRIREGRPGF